MARKEREADAVEWRACVHEKGARGRAHVVCVGVCAFFFPPFFSTLFLKQEHNRRRKASKHGRRSCKSVQLCYFDDAL